LVSVEASGHAGAGISGEDIVCSAVTILLRTTLRVLDAGTDPQGRPEIEAKTAGRGSLAFRVTAFKEADMPLLRFAGAFLEQGLGSLVAEYPENLTMRVERLQN
jgi:uncharacterized protein YsxB (DUF464 family)